MPAHNAASLLPAALAPLLAMRERGEIGELLVVDDASSDDTVSVAQSFPGVRVIRRVVRGGPGAARNTGASEACGEYLWFVDSDVVLAEDAARVLDAALQDIRPTAVFGSYDDAPAAQNFLSQYKNLVHAYYHRRGRRDASTFWAGCGAVKRRAFLDAGGFDASRYPQPSIEDIELGYRLRSAGATIASVPDIRGKHLKVWRFPNLVHTDVFRRAIPWSTLMLERGALTDDLNVSRGERWRVALALALAVAWVTAFAGAAPLWAAAIVTGVVIAANGELVGFFARRRGALFAARAFLYHQFHYLYSAGAFAFAVVRHAMGRSRS